MVKIYKNGFTFLELLIALAIIAILTTTSLILVKPQLDKARDAKIKDDLIQIRNALTQYYDDNKCFPVSIPSCGKPFQTGNTIYMTSVPCSPSGSSYEYETANTTCNNWFKVLANLSNINDPSIKAVGCTNGCGKLCNYNFGITSTNVSLNQGCPQTPQNYYACAPNGSCIIYSNPAQSQCPITFLNDPTCQNKCSQKVNKCHDESGKQN
jgi:prepilin-type N-terminal cleavage/methylation domain-containing protein